MENMSLYNALFDNENENHEDNSMSINNNERYEAASTEAVSSVNPAEEATNATNETIQEGNYMTTSTSEQTVPSTTSTNTNGTNMNNNNLQNTLRKPRGPRTNYALLIGEYCNYFTLFNRNKNLIMEKMGINSNQERQLFNLMNAEIAGTRRPTARAEFAVSKDGGITISASRLSDNKVSKIFQPETKLFVRQVGNGLYIGLLEEKDDIEISVTRKSEQTQNTVESGSTDIPVTGENQNQVRRVAA